MFVDLGDIGAFLIALGFSAALVSAGAYAMQLRRPDEGLIRLARGGFYAMVFAVMFGAAILMYLILSHQFDYQYVWAHSSLSLAKPFLFAAFYSGQEGSFFLWSFLTAMIGVFVIGYAQKYKYESEAMSVYMLVMALLLLILVVDSPFTTIFAAFADQNLPKGFMPPDGKGLNPQLENLWITIHPPMLFVGFAAMTVPFVFAIAGLIRRDYQRWISIALPWTLFASMILGFGIMLGGWWAYETLGWGGYWAWDPVENSSLIPWLICVALLHTMIVQKRTGIVRREETVKVGGLARTNFLLAILSFGGILYSTFLTRSGVLEDTSVHSFVTPGNFVYAVLLIILLSFLAMGGAALLWRWRDIRTHAMSLNTLSRENWLGFGAAALLASAFIVLVGTSWPILMPLIGNPKAKIDTSFYNNTHLLIGLAIVVINGLSVMLAWKSTKRDELKKRLIVTVPSALVLTALAGVLYGMKDIEFLILTFGAFFALIANGMAGWKMMQGSVKLAGAFVAHLGLCVLIFGVIFTSGYSMTEHVELVEGATTEIFGYRVTYNGQVRIEKEKVDREKYEHHISLTKDGTERLVKPVVFWSDFNKREQAFLEPGIIYYPTRDLYVSPKSLGSVGGDPTVVLGKGERAPLPFDSSITVRFEKFDMSRAESEQMQGAVVEVTTKDTAMYVTAYRMIDGNFGMTPVPGVDLKIGFAELQANPDELSKSKARLRLSSSSYTSPPEKRAITVDISVKPFISLVWGGVIIMVIGFFISILRRRDELRSLLRFEEVESIEEEIRDQDSAI